MDSNTVDTEPPRTIFTIAVVAAAAVLWTVVLALFLFLVPAFERIFVDFQLQVPYITERVIDVSRWCTHYLLIIPIELLVIVAGVAGSTWLLRHVLRQRWLAHLWCL